MLAGSQGLWDATARTAPFSWDDRVPWPVSAVAAPASITDRDATAPLATGTPPPRISADAYVLVDGRSGRVLLGRNAHQQRAPASTTKIMTGVLALELGDADDVVAVSPRAAGTPGSSAHISTGDRYRLEDLVRGLLMKSGNDAAVALAEHLAGSVAAFAGLMNDKARLLGLHDTRFVNPHGLTAPGHFTSAYDLARLARYALTLPEFAAIVRTSHSTLPGLDARDQAIARNLYNTNRLLAYEWVTGVKTGTTDAAGDCLVASASKDGGELIAVVLHSDDRWQDAFRLLEWGFTEFRFRHVLHAGQVVVRIPVFHGMRASVPAVAGADLDVTASSLEAPRLRVVVNPAPSVPAPVRAGQPVGSVSVVAGSEVLGRAPLVAAGDVPSRRWWNLFTGNR